MIRGTKRGHSASEDEVKNDLPTHRSDTNNESQSDVSVASTSSSGDSALSKISRKKKNLARKSLRRAKRKEKAHVKNLEKNKISMDDFLSKQTELRIWLSEVKHKAVEELSSLKLKVYFKTFVKLWNKKKLPEKYYRGMVTPSEPVKMNKPINQRFSFATDIDVEEMYKIHVPDLFSIPQEDILSLDSPFTTFGKQPSVTSFGLSSTDSEYSSALSVGIKLTPNLFPINQNILSQKEQSVHENEPLDGKRKRSHVYDIPYVPGNTSSEDDKQTNTTPVMKFGRLLKIRNKKSITPYKVTTLQWSEDGKLVFGSSECKNSCKPVRISSSENDTSFSISATSETSASSIDPNSTESSNRTSRTSVSIATEKAITETPHINHKTVEKALKKLNDIQRNGNSSVVAQSCIKNQDSNVSLYECMDQSVCRPQNSTQLASDAHIQSVYECMDQSSIHPDLNQSTFREALDQSVLRKDRMKELESVIHRKTPIGNEKTSQDYRDNNLNGQMTSDYIAIDHNASKRLSISMLNENQYYELEKSDMFCVEESSKLTDDEKIVSGDQSHRPLSYLYAVPLKRSERESIRSESMQKSIAQDSNQSEDEEGKDHVEVYSSIPMVKNNDETPSDDKKAEVSLAGGSALKETGNIIKDVGDGLKVHRNSSTGSDGHQPVLRTNYNRFRRDIPKQEDLELIDMPQVKEQCLSDKENDDKIGGTFSRGRTPKKQIKMGIGNSSTGPILPTKPHSAVPPDLKSSRKKYQITSV